LEGTLGIPGICLPGALDVLARFLINEDCFVCDCAGIGTIVEFDEVIFEPGSII
jgi:hypothetical protein